MLRSLRVAKSLRLWVPDHLRFCAAQVIDIERNRRAGLGDDDHLAEAVAWLQRAQDVTKDGGVSGRYHLSLGWTSSYPETTGYIIPTFLKLADIRSDRAFVDRAARCVRFLLSTQLKSGAFPGGEIAENNSEPSPFNSAQIIHGLLAWHRRTNDERALEAALRAADWLISVQDADGAFHRYFYQDAPATYSSHATCWLAELGAHTGDLRYLRAAGRHLDWVLQQFDESKAWFDLCGFTPDDHKARVAVTHAIAYTIFGVLYTSQLLRREDGIQAARLAALGALRRAEIRGSVPGVMAAGWRASADYICLTGNAQLASIWFRLYELDHDLRYVNAALKALDEVKRAQPMHLKHPGLRGGVPGSAPMWGDYIRFAVPNWAAKFFIDALLTKKEVMGRLDRRELGTPAAEPDREVAALRGGVPVPDNLKVVCYTSTGSDTPHKLFNETARWGFSPAAVIVETSAPVPFRARLQRKLRDGGVAALARALLGRMPFLAGSGPEGTPAGVSVEQLCSERGIPLLTVQSVNSPDALHFLAELRPDLAILLGAGIVRKALLDIPKYGTLNAHMGLLPFYRGMNVAEWALLNGDGVGCTVHQVDTGIDTGSMIATRSVSSTAAGSIVDLRDLVDRAQIKLLAEVLEWICANHAMPVTRAQTIEEGRQFFRMHDDLKRILEQSLSHAMR